MALYDYSNNNNHEALAALLTTEAYYQLAPSQTHSEFALFGKELDCASVVTATHAPSSHRFLSTWGAVMLKKKQKKTITVFTVGYCCFSKELTPLV